MPPHQLTLRVPPAYSRVGNPRSSLRQAEDQGGAVFGAGVGVSVKAVVLVGMSVGIGDSWACRPGPPCLDCSERELV
jgi:hypothetical protein